MPSKISEAERMKPGKSRDLRDACVAEALLIIGEVGLEALSIREVARRLGVSHQAPYKHFASSDHLLAEVVRRTYAMFSAHLEQRPAGRDADEDLLHMGQAYFQFAQQHPLHYRLMFGTPLPDPSQHPEMMQEARHAFQLLLSAVRKNQLDAVKRPPEGQAELDALFVWAAVHGLSTLLESKALHQMGFPPAILNSIHHHTLACIGKAILLPAGRQPANKTSKLH